MEEDKEFEPIDLNEIRIAEKYEENLRMTRIPWSLWGLAAIAIGCASFLLGNVIGNKDIIATYRGGAWWQYFIIVMLYVFGVVVFLCGKIEIVLFQKETGLFTHNKWILCYKWKGFCCGLADIANVTLEKEGVKKDLQDTIHYKVLVVFRHAAPLRILETKSRTRAMEKVREIRSFLGMEGGFVIKDESKV
jgi:hypothetical protein